MHEFVFRTGSLTVHWYGILVAAGFMAGYWTAQRRGLRDGLSPDAAADVIFWLFLGGIVFARLKKLPVWKLADALVPRVPLGHASLLKAKDTVTNQNSFHDG